LAAIAVGAVVLLFAIYSVLLAPKGKQLKAQRAKLSEAQSQEESLKATLRRLQALALQRPARQAELARLASAVPNTPDLAGFIVSADKLATDSGVDWVSVSPSVPSAGAANTPSTIAMSIQVQGGFFQVLDYLNRLEHLERVVVVDSVNLSATDNGTASPPITVNLSARMFTSAPAARTGSAGAGGATGATTTTAPGTPTTTAGSVTTATTRPASP
jgi:Tfp pilus assembly protein PilO